ncbi:Rieske 2Fe-2S domain-containing protein [Pseudonocardia yunnanensis]|uniref:Rieske 2Fe-2S domain-containing protein n=1 Tax=Pseudonocardia yunnanensis TaxID=58107 RepID=A0ABW4F566_9PSEU
MLSTEDNALLTKVGRGTPVGNLYRRFWHPVVTAARLPEPDGAPLRVRILGENLILFRDTAGQVGALEALCPHRRTQLFWGRNEEGGLRCAYHGWKFDVSGQCVDMPTEPAESTYKDRLRTIGYPVVERGGFVWVYMGPRDKQPPLPGYEWMDLPADRRLSSSFLQESNYLQALEGDVDTAHVSYLHRFLDPETAPQPPQMVEGYRHFVIQDTAPRLSVKQTDYGFLYGGRRTLADGNYYWRITQWLAPAATQLPSAGQFGTAKINVPIDDENTMSFGVYYNPSRALRKGEWYEPSVSTEAYRLSTGHLIDHPRGMTNLDNDYLIDREAEKNKFVGVKGGTGAEDRAVTESMGAIMDRSAEHLGVSDIAIVAMRRALLRMARDLENGIEPTLPARAELFNTRGLDVISEHADFQRLLEEQADALLADQGMSPTAP